MNDSLPTHQSHSESAQGDRPTSTMTAKIGAWLQLAPLVGVAGTIRGMMSAFKTLGTSGVGDPSKLSGAIGEVLIFSFIGLMFGLVGAVLLGIALFKQKCSARWVRILFGISLFPILVPLGHVLLRSFGI